MYCEKCGAEIKETDKFCDKCGNKIKYENRVTENNHSDKKASDRKKLRYGITVILAVILIAFIINGFGSLGKDGRNPNKDFPVLENLTASSSTFEFKVNRAWATDYIKCPKEKRKEFGSKYLSPIDEKAIFYIVEYTFTNTSDKPLDERPVIQLIDASGTVYDRDETTTVYTKSGGTSPDYLIYDEGISLSEAMQPGLSIKGQCTFIIARDRLDKNGCISCKKLNIKGNNALAELIGGNIGATSAVQISLDGIDGDAIVRRQEEEKEADAQKRREILTTSNKYFKVTEETSLYDYVGPDGNESILCTIPAGHYVEYNRYGMDMEIYEKAGFMFVNYNGYTEENPYKSVEYEGYVDKGALTSNTGETFEHASKEEINRYYEELYNQESSSPSVEIPDDMANQQEDSLIGIYQCTFDDQGEAGLEIKQSDEQADAIFDVIFSGSYDTYAGETEGYIIPHTDGSDGIWDYFENDSGSYNPSMLLAIDETTFTIKVTSLDGNNFGGMNFPGFEGIYQKSPN